MDVRTVRGIFSGMTLKRMDNVGVVVDDLAAAVAFFKELGLELEGEAQVEGRSVDRLIGLEGVRIRHRNDADSGRPRARASSDSAQGSFAMMALARATTSGLIASAVRPDGTLTWKSRECLPVQTVSSA